MKTTALTSAFVLLQTRFPKIYYDIRVKDRHDLL